jgi:hypothetical protein
MNIIGIDPDTNKSGVAWISPDFPMRLYNLSLWSVFEFLADGWHEDNLTVVVERYEGKNRSWHGGGKGSAYDVGRNAEIANQIVAFCEAHDIKCVTVQPNGYSNMKAEVFNKVFGWEGRTNPETRAAAQIADYYKRVLSKVKQIKIEYNGTKRDLVQGH